VEIFAAETQTICLNDFALVLLDRNLDQPPYNLPISPIRLYSGVEVGEQIRMVGYGSPTSGKDATVDTRNTRGGLIVSRVGKSDEYRPVGDNIPPRTFATDGPGGCYSDSGGPAYSDNDAVIGVFSQFVGDCYSQATVNYFTEVAPFRDAVVLRAFKASGYEPWLENNSEPGLYGTGGNVSTGGTASSGGAPATGGAPSTEAGGASGTTIVLASGGATVVATAATGGVGDTPMSTVASEAGGAPAAVGGAQANGGAPEQTGGSSQEVVVYDRGPSQGGSCACRVGRERRYALGAIAAMAMLLGTRRRRARRNRP
jgi:hypothetical protein